MFAARMTIVCAPARAATTINNAAVTNLVDCRWVEFIGSPDCL
jgi:hypothetical protein